MSKRCDLTGVGPMSGHKISHSNRKSKRRFVPNLQNVSFLSSILGQNLSLKVTPATLRTVDHNGGLDNYLLSTSNLKLTTIAQKIKRKLKKAISAKPELNSEEIKAETAKKPAKAIRPKKKTPAEKATAKGPAKRVVKVKAKKVAQAKKATAKAAPKKTAAK